MTSAQSFRLLFKWSLCIPTNTAPTYEDREASFQEKIILLKENKLSLFWNGWKDISTINAFYWDFM